MERELQNLRCQLKIDSESESFRDKAFYIIKQNFIYVDCRTVSDGYEFSFDCYVYKELMELLNKIEKVNISVLVYSTDLKLVSFRTRKEDKWEDQLSKGCRVVYVTDVVHWDKVPTNEQIMEGYKNGIVQKYSLEEFEELMNKDEINITINYIRVL